jgi:ribulose-phosphate 3-epimerase
LNYGEIYKRILNYSCVNVIKEDIMSKLLCPSLMCANYGNLEKELKDLEAADIDIFHIDIMDGQFVPNFGMGLQDVEFICKNAKKKVDAHLMIENPGSYVEKFAEMGVDIIYIHPESDVHPTRTLQKIIDSGAEPGIAINPGTALETVTELLPFVKYVMVMTVNPGFAGQKYIESVDKKIKKLIGLQEEFDYEVMIDGACAPSRIKYLSEMGVKGFILGTSALFGKDKPYAEIIKELRRL